jgi:TolA-binding protein
MSTQDRDNKLLDYLYDEMDPSARHEFEQELTNSAPLTEDMERLQQVRSMMKNVEEEIAPGALMNDIMRQARLAIEDEAKVGFAERLLQWLTTPALATGALAIALIAVGGYLSTKEPAPHSTSMQEGYNVALLEEKTEITTSVEFEPEPTEALTAIPPSTEIPAAAVAEIAPRETKPTMTSKEVKGSDLTTLEPVPGAAAPAKTRPSEPTKAIAMSQGAKTERKAGSAGKRATRSSTKVIAKAKTARSRVKRQVDAPAVQVANVDNPVFPKGSGSESTNTRAELDTVNSKTTLEDDALINDGIATAYGAPSARANGARSAAKTKPAAVVAAKQENSTAQKEDFSPPPNWNGGPRDRNGIAQLDGTLKGRRNLRPSSTMSSKAYNTQSEPRDTAPETYRRQGMRHFNQQRFALALRDLKRYVETEKPSKVPPAVHRKLAKSYGYTNQARRAIRAYNQLLSNYPNYKNRAAVLLEVALLHVKLGNLETARTLLREASKDRSVAGKARQRLKAIEEKLSKRTRTKKTKASARKKPAAKKAATDEAPTQK